MSTDPNIQLIPCRKCGYSYQPELLDSAGRCHDCRREIQRQWDHRSEDHSRTWNDVRGMRRLAMELCDWTQLADVPESTRTKWTTYRQAWRDVTKQPNAATAILPTPPE
jgi:hypothetical protein